MVKGSLAEIFSAVRHALALVPVDSPDTEAVYLCERFLCSCYKGNLRGRAALACYGDNLPGQEEAARIFEAVRQREARPLQYILGEWEFLDMSLSVGEGVLCPREDSAALVFASLEALKGVENPQILDLCAGSGAIALGICSKNKSCTALCAELSPKAFVYLEKNIEKYGDGRVSAQQADVLSPDFSCPGLEDRRFDLICSNPPYIPSGELSSLAREVRQEPEMALDGGADGLRFYRVICEAWRSLLRSGGTLACELGEGQFEAVKEIYVRSNLDNIRYFKDFSGIIRVIVGTKL